MRTPSVAPKNAGRERVPAFVLQGLAAEREFPSERKSSLHARYATDRKAVSVRAPALRGPGLGVRRQGGKDRGSTFTPSKARRLSALRKTRGPSACIFIWPPDLFQREVPSPSTIRTIAIGSRFSGTSEGRHRHQARPLAHLDIHFNQGAAFASCSSPVTRSCH